MKLINYIGLSISLILIFVLVGCADILDQQPDQILTEDEVFGDEVIMQSVLANYYGRVTYFQHNDDSYGYTLLDEAGKSDGGPDHFSSYPDDFWRVYDYGLIRNINQFLEGLRASEILDDQAKLRYEGEARFIRAWVYFNMLKGLGGMPIVGDEVFEYTGVDGVSKMQLSRASEAELYDYIISECDEIAEYLPVDPTINAARATKWAAIMLKARAAIYGGSIANYNNKMTNPISTNDGAVGIPANRAEGFYQTALSASQEVIQGGKYELQLNTPDDLGRNFYEAVSVKDNNVEVIWARDRIYPGQTIGFSTINVPASHAEDIDRAYAGPILNLVEDFEYIHERDGKIKIEDVHGNYIFYDNPEDAFADKDARLWGTVIYPGAEFKGMEVVLQAGQKYLENGEWKTLTGQPGDRDDNRELITSINGPVIGNEQFINKTGFFFRKFLDETTGASTRGRRSDMWMPRFRFAEALLIAAEAAFELNQVDQALNYINQIRTRAGIQELETLTFDDIVRENRVEFAFEDHRYWDLKRWRIAHQVWNGVQNDPEAQHYALFPYLVNDPGSPNNGKWVFDKRLFANSPNPRFFQLRNYYNFLDQGWLNNNPELTKNPFQ